MVWGDLGLLLKGYIRDTNSPVQTDPNHKDWTAGLVFSGLGLVQSQSFSSLGTGLSNTINNKYFQKRK